MSQKTISMCGAAWLLSHVRSFATKSDFVTEQMTGSAFRDKTESTRRTMFEQVYDLAVPPVIEKKKKK